jgi:soluble lytic murein transglycosylase-like protein
MQEKDLQNRSLKAERTLMRFVACAGIATTLTLSILPGWNEAKAAKLSEAEESAAVSTMESLTKAPERTYFDCPLSHDLQDYIADLCEEAHIDPAVIIAMIGKESTYRADAKGDKGKSLGLMQIQPRWHYDRMEKLDCDDLLDPYDNVTVGIDFLCELVNKYDGNMHMALMAYNAGASGAKRNWFSKGIYENKYSRAVMKLAEELKAGAYIEVQ